MQSIEFIGRKVLQPRKFITDALGKEAIERIYDYADVFHCETIAILETAGRMQAEL